ncbi:MAG TPA: DUF5985 family protein [Terracidiphilus sp.]|nr:DUF5985 family protein [Terracidiphilus sp.]
MIAGADLMHPLAPLSHPFADAFLLGFISACSFVAALFFLKFWNSTRDTLFLAFSLFFAIQGIGNSALLGVAHPNQGGLWNAVLRLLSSLGVLAAILWKNLAER